MQAKDDSQAAKGQGSLMGIWGPAGLPEVTPQLLYKYPFQFKLQPPRVLGAGPGPLRQNSTVAPEPLLPESCPDCWPTESFPFNLQGTLTLTAHMGPGHTLPPLCAVPHPCSPSTSQCYPGLPLGLCPARPLHLKVCALSLALPCP